MITVVATDLDRTLIYSAAAIAEVNAIGQLPPLLCVEMLDGRQQSYMTVAAARWLERLRAQAVLVPTTTRTLAQYERVRLPGGQSNYAITSNGGDIVLDGVVDQGWRLAVESRIAREGASLLEVMQGLARQAAGSWVVNRKVADNLFCYLVVELAKVPLGFFDTWTSWCKVRGWVVSMQGRKIYAVPAGLTKQAAVAEVMQRVGAERLIAAGDGALDAGFLSMADFAIRPSHGELAEAGWQSAQMRIASAPGVLAGEEISRCLASAVGAGDQRQTPHIASTGSCARCRTHVTRGSGA